MSRQRGAALDFFQAQEDALRRSRRLVWAVVLGTTIIGSLVGLLTGLSLFYGGGGNISHDEAVMAGLAAFAVVAVMVTVTSCWKTAELRSGGGQAVAEFLGGSQVHHDTKDADERRLLNVVEEMAIASGLPVPPVYIIEESAVNAFAAGWDPQHAVLGFTRGAIQRLSRDELQGVAAHEFSHIMRGDMLLNLRLIGLLHGLLAVSLTGALLLRLMAVGRGGGTSHRGRGGGRGGGGNGVMIAIFVAAIALYILGSLGVFIARLIQAAVSRQREFLADAAAVQFTRNPDGIAGALKRLHGGRTKMRSANAGVVGHMFIAAGVRNFSGALLATHPPLPQRIRRLDPAWDGRPPPPRPEPASSSPVDSPEVDEKARSMMRMMATAALAQQSAGSAAQIHAPRLPAAMVPDADDALALARSRVAALPDVLSAAAADPFDARAVLVCCVLGETEAARGEQARLLQAADPGLGAAAARLWPCFRDHDPAAIRPLLLRLAAPSLSTLTAEQAAAFRTLLQQLVDADQQLSLAEQATMSAVAASLDPPPRVDFLSLRGVSRECAVLLHALGVAGNDSGAALAGLQVLGLHDQPLITNGNLAEALDRLGRASPTIRQRVLDACRRAAAHDGKLGDEQALMLELVASALRLPMV